MLIWDVDSMLKAIENNPKDFELRLVDTTQTSCYGRIRMLRSMKLTPWKQIWRNPVFWQKWAKAIIFCWTVITV